MKTRNFLLMLSLAAVALAQGCASSGGVADAEDNYGDPFEKVNRKILDFNLKLDRYALKPAAEVYAKAPNPLRKGVRNFFSNLREPYTVLNDLLQGKPKKAWLDATRFVFNTTFGIFGIFDFASTVGLKKTEPEDFGQTLAVWGVPEGPYLVLPVLGPSSLRDGSNLVPRFAIHPSNPSDALLIGNPTTAYLDSPDTILTTGVNVVSVRADLLGTEDLLERQLDPYTFLREGYRQRRLQAIHDGNPPTDAEDSLLDELLDD